MRVLLRAAAGAVALSMLLSGLTLAKGEEFTAAIGPIDPATPGTPMRVSVQLAVDGRPFSGSDLHAYISFTEVTDSPAMRLEFPLLYDTSTGSYVATVTLPHAGRWQIDVGTRYGDSTVPFGRIDGPRNVIVPAAPAAPPPTAQPSVDVGSLLAGAAAASALWLLGIGAFVLRRRRGAGLAGPAPMRKQITA